MDSCYKSLFLSLKIKIWHRCFQCTLAHKIIEFANFLIMLLNIFQTFCEFYNILANFLWSSRSRHHIWLFAFTFLFPEKRNSMSFDAWFCPLNAWNRFKMCLKFLFCFLHKKMFVDFSHWWHGNFFIIYLQSLRLFSTQF